MTKTVNALKMYGIEASESEMAGIWNKRLMKAQRERCRILYSDVVCCKNRDSGIW